MATDTDEIFASFYEEIKRSTSIEEVIRDWGGISISVPAYRGKWRDTGIVEYYRSLDPTQGVKHRMVQTAREFGVSTRKVKSLIPPEAREPNLFSLAETQ